MEGLFVTSVSYCCSWLVRAIAREGITADRLSFGSGNQHWQHIFQCYKVSDASIIAMHMCKHFLQYQLLRNIFILCVYISCIKNFGQSIFRAVKFRTTMILTKFI